MGSNWIRCPKCGHKLFRCDSTGAGMKLEIKCSSCKSILTLQLDGGKCSISPLKEATGDFKQ